MKKSLLVIGILAIAAAMSSCGGNANNAPASTDTKPATEQSTTPKADDAKADDAKADDAAAKPATTTQSVDLNKKSVCPTRDGSSDQPGECPACGMDLIEN